MSYATRIPHTGEAAAPEWRVAYRAAYAEALGAGDSVTLRTADVIRDMAARELESASELVNRGERAAAERYRTAARQRRFGLHEGAIDGERESERRGARVNPHLS